MMAPNPVAAKEGAMKDIAECIGLFMRLSRNWCRLFLGLGGCLRLQKTGSRVKRFTQIYTEKGADCRGLVW